MQLAKNRSFFNKLESDGTNPYLGKTAWMVFGSSTCIFSATKASSSTQITVDWGDGTSSTFSSSISNATHTYSQKGYYVVVISDDITTIQLGCYDKTSQYLTVLQLYCTGSKVSSLPSYALNSSGYAITESEIDLSMLKPWITEYTSVSSFAGYCIEGNNGFAKYRYGYNGYARSGKVSFPCLTAFNYSQFYSSGLSQIEHLYLDNLVSFGGSDYISGASGGTGIQHIYIRNKTLSQIKAMSGFPGISTSAANYSTCIIHGSDGNMHCNGTIV